MEYKNSVEVFKDRTYTVIKNENGHFKFTNLSTRTLTDIIKTLHTLEKVDDEELCLACCYQQYDGSFNVKVDPKEQYQRIYEYASDVYSTFLKKYNDAA